MAPAHPAGGRCRHSGGHDRPPGRQRADGILAHVGADNVKGGEAQGQLIMALFPDGAKVLNLQGQPGSSPAIDRNAGVHNVLDKHADKYPFVFEQTANFARDKGLSVTEAGLAGMARAA